MAAQKTSIAVPTPNQIADAAVSLGRVLDGEQVLGLSRYLELLLVWNQRMNLVGPQDWHTILADLIADSWHLADFLNSLNLPEAPCTVDLGAGAGLPGLPLRLFWPHGVYHLVEIRRKRTAFLLQVLSAMQLQRTFVRPQRAEQALPALAPVDLCLSRAFLPWPELLKLVKPWLARGAAVVIMANEPVPSVMPPDWVATGSHRYTGSDKDRYFWSLVPANISR
ncbi:16S rRNA (guanine527-N7)-methyltransferase [Desulfonatronum thiosulfatophilum]|uniref:Ribosomal RNA small subunit methyltransferase G n=1 Tax=Desulfonatronum thiosulfatophilum TaxID=617002 RepID=A0A1G6CV85_9BACT|nr:RsmG family class I SAM-dependent methyltransferase [Desulfonatronum thiosulfatophilum]SDB36788.1 16S rRNA (guanine527-N7)-methyltransferase [Desulfonatronum thiosulfatophilum]